MNAWILKIDGKDSIGELDYLTRKAVWHVTSACNGEFG